MSQHVALRSTPSSRPRLRGLARAAAASAAAFGLLVIVPAAASAHVTVQPGEVEGGGFAVVAFRVPNERDDARTTRVRVLLPEDHPLGSVSTTPVPGWRATTRTRTLAKPVDMFGENVSEVVSEVIWTATGDGVAPGEFQDFDLSIGPLPDSGELVFNTFQSYSSGENVAWNEVAVDGASEPEHPAPVLAVIPPAEDTGSADQSAADTLPLTLSGIAVVLSAAALFLSWRRGRP
jgi:uncharacterized protein YcnI